MADDEEEGTLSHSAPDESTAELLDTTPEIKQADSRAMGGRYRIERQLGRGGFGVVYLARDNRLDDRRVVVKLLRPDAAANDPGLLKSFRKEMHALSRVNHPNVVGVSDFGETEDGRPFMVMEFVPGGSLRDAMRNDRLPLTDVVEILRQCCDALDAVHKQAIWHRDLKPENVFLRRLELGGWHAKIGDFGIATVLQSQQSVQHTTAASGTPPYMAPEQFNRQPSARSDIWALGVMAYELTTGRFPFPSESIARLIESQREGVAVRPRALRPEIPVAVDQAIIRALEFEPARRQQSALEFARAMAAAGSSVIVADSLAAPTDGAEFGEGQSPAPLSPRVLFDRDPIVGTVIALYERFGLRYLFAQSVVMCLVPLAVILGPLRAQGLLLGPCGQPSPAEALAGFAAIFGLAPALGTALGYRWLRLLVRTPHLLARAGVIPQESADSALSWLIGRTSRPLLALTAVVLLYPIGSYTVQMCAMEAPVREGPRLAAGLFVYLLSIDAAWWYIILKLALAVLVFAWLMQHVLSAPTVKVHLGDRDCGFKALSDLSFSFLVVYAFVVGGYLTLTLAGPARMSDPLMVAVALAYMSVPLLWVSKVLYPAHLRIATAQDGELVRLDAEIRRLDALNKQGAGSGQVYADLQGLRVERERIEDLSTWPMGRLRKNTVAFLLLVPVFGSLLQSGCRTLGSG
jgi:serine/threonine-protein kinase